ncbi:hypothetical protein Tco_1402206 [Tanacetum coccineum]
MNELLISHRGSVVVDAGDAVVEGNIEKFNSLTALGNGNKKSVDDAAFEAMALGNQKRANVQKPVGESVAAPEICCRRQKHRYGAQKDAATGAEHLVLPESKL